MADTQLSPTQQPSQPAANPKANAAAPLSVPAVKPMDPEKIHVIVRNRMKILFDENVKAISSKNDTGVFDILPEHSNFISLITSPLIMRKMDGTRQEITFQNGIIKVKDSTVHCYIDLISKEATIPTAPVAQKNNKK